MNKTKKKVQDIAQKLATFESTHENKEGMQNCLDFCKSFFLDKERFEIHEINNQNITSLIITPRGISPKDIDVLLLGHIDTVPGPKELFTGKIVDGWLYGRGTLDMKAFVATSIISFSEAVKNNTRPIGLLITTDEELGGRYGSRYIAEEKIIQPKIILVPDDGENINQIVKENKSILHVEFNARGKESHACRPWDGENAIEMLYPVIRNLKSHFESCNKAKEFSWIDTMNIGTISGGVATNEVPAEAKMSVDIRFTKNTSREEIIKKIEKSLITNVEYNILDEMKGTSINQENNNIYKLYESAIEQVTQKKVNYIQSGGGTDGDHFANKEVVIIKHQGTGFDCQSETERVYLPSLDQLVETQLLFLNNYFNNKNT